ncbi:hypothetical protein DENSPDRAFT_886521 [Dentipellis sp. KUC8613]|nr:hypothetical protein DENSPDRAFT_886521 [Dentipellis sp. KUC8613]
MEEILEAIKIYEGTQRFIKGIGHSSDAKDGKQSTTKTESNSTSKAEHAPGQYTGRTFRLVSRNRNNGGASRPRPTHTNQQRGPVFNSSAAPKGATPAARDNGLPKCYACGQVGHISTDPKCPQYGKARTARAPAISNNANRPRRLFAAQVVDERSEQEDEQPQDEPPEPISEVEDNDLEPNEAYADEQEAVGSQYDSEYELEEFEEYDGYEEADSDNNVVYLRAGFVHNADEEIFEAMATTNAIAGPEEPEEPEPVFIGPWDSPGRPNGPPQRRRWEELGDHQWSYSLDYGYYHARECYTCGRYLAHIQNALQSQQFAILPAYAERHEYIQSMERVGWAKRHSLIDSPLDVEVRRLDRTLRQKEMRIRHTDDRVVELTRRTVELEWDLAGSHNEVEIMNKAAIHYGEVIAGLRERIDQLQEAESHFITDNLVLQAQVCELIRAQTVPPTQPLSLDDNPSFEREASVLSQINLDPEPPTDEQAQRDLQALADELMRHFLHEQYIIDEDIPRMVAMQMTDAEDVALVRSAMCRPLQAQIKGRRPPTAAAEHQCLSAYVTVHGLNVLALFDSGSTSESVTPDALGTHPDDPTDRLNGADGKNWETINGLIP